VIVVFVLLPLAVAFFGFWVWMFVDAVRNERFSRRDKTFWAIVLLALRPVGALIYYVKQYRPRHTDTHPTR
jgi:hypothetical protein